LVFLDMFYVKWLMKVFYQAFEKQVGKNLFIKKF